MSQNRIRLLRSLKGAASVAVLLGLFTGGAEAGGIQVELNHSRALQLAAPAATVMVSNPAIADVSIQGAQLVYVLARSYGKTDLIALDAAGKQIAQYEIDVVAPRSSAVTLMRGTEQLTYNCTPRCEPVVNPSDSSNAFNAALSQATAARSLGAGAATASGTNERQ